MSTESIKDGVTRALARHQRTFMSFTPGQKAVAVVGTLALLLAGFMIFRWASTPSYAPLYSNLSSSDASAVIDKLDSQGVPYKLTNGGNTVMVPKDKVYSTRISLSGQGLPGSSDNGYSILDKQSLSTSSFQEQTNFKRAMESELSRTIEALNGVDTAVVHLALPAKQVFADKQDPATASVLVVHAARVGPGRRAGAGDRQPGGVLGRRARAGQGDRRGRRRARPVRARRLARASPRPRAASRSRTTRTR